MIAQIASYNHILWSNVKKKKVSILCSIDYYHVPCYFKVELSSYSAQIEKSLVSVLNANQGKCVF